MPTPYGGPTSAQFAPRMGHVHADNAIVPIQTIGYSPHVPHISYIVQPEDTLASVTKLLYGTNTPANRHKVRSAGFQVGNVIHVPVSNTEGNANGGYRASL